MFLLRFVLFGAIIVLGVALALWLFTGKRGYLRFAWRFLRFVLVVVVVIGLLLVVERLMVIV